MTKQHYALMPDHTPPRLQFIQDENAFGTRYKASATDVGIEYIYVVEHIDFDVLGSGCLACTDDTNYHGSRTYSIMHTPMTAIN